MNLNYNDAEQKNEYVTKKTFVITTVILSIALIIVTIFLLFYFNSKLQKTVESLEIKDDLTLIQKEDNSWINNVNVEWIIVSIE